MKKDIFTKDSRIKEMIEKLSGIPCAKSMLKVLGYRNKEINSMVLNVYHLLVPIAIILSFILGFFGTKAVFTANVLVYKTYLETCIYPISVIKMSLLVLGSYAGSLFLLRGKAGKVDLVESLKDNRE